MACSHPGECEPGGWLHKLAGRLPGVCRGARPGRVHQCEGEGRGAGRSSVQLRYQTAARRSGMHCMLPGCALAQHCLRPLPLPPPPYPARCTSMTGESRTGGATRCPSIRCGPIGAGAGGGGAGWGVCSGAHLAAAGVISSEGHDPPSCTTLWRAPLRLARLSHPLPSVVIISHSCRGFSYFDAVLAPIVDALNLALTNSSDAWLSLQAGRQGAGRFPALLVRRAGACARL